MYPAASVPCSIANIIRIIIHAKQHKHWDVVCILLLVVVVFVLGVRDCWLAAAGDSQRRQEGCNQRELPPTAAYNKWMHSWHAQGGLHLPQQRQQV